MKPDVLNELKRKGGVPMAIKFNEYWNVIPDRMQEYIDFMQRSRIPTMNGLGVQVVALWSSLIGSSPQIISEGLAIDLDHVESALKSEEFRRTNAKLLTMVADYRSKVMVSSNRFKELPRACSRGTIKFSQYWDIIPGKEADYDHYIKNVFHPGMENLGMEVRGEWYVLIGESPHMFFESGSDTAERLLVSLKSQKFRVLKNDLLKLVCNYSSRVLVYHACKNKTSGSNEYEFFLI